MTCEHGFIGACAECDGSGQSTEQLSHSVQELDIEERECISCGRIMSDRERVENHGRCEDCLS